jgi:hypothetical protein
VLEDTDEEGVDPDLAVGSVAGGQEQQQLGGEEDVEAARCGDERAELPAGATVISEDGNDRLPIHQALDEDESGEQRSAVANAAAESAISNSEGKDGKKPVPMARRGRKAARTAAAAPPPAAPVGALVWDRVERGRLYPPAAQPLPRSPREAMRPAPEVAMGDEAIFNRPA